MSNLNERTTQEVFDHHNEYLPICNLDEVMLDYCEESVIINMGGPVIGLEAIRAFFKGSMETCLPAETVYEDLTKHVHGDMAYYIWKADSPFYEVPYGTDTFIIKNGKIIMQTFAGILIQKTNE